MAVAQQGSAGDTAAFEAERTRLVSDINLVHPPSLPSIPWYPHGINQDTASKVTMDVDLYSFYDLQTHRK